MDHALTLVVNTKTNAVHCPYNNAHSMPQKTMIMHLTKCPDKNSDLKLCMFNNLHAVEKSKLIAHETQCLQRTSFDQDCYKINSDKLEVTLRGPVTNDDLDETWDDQHSSNTTPVQNVIKMIKEKPCYMKPPAGLTKSDRKKYRIEAAQKACSSTDLPNKPVCSTHDVSQSNQQVKNKGLFFGNRPNT